MKIRSFYKRLDIIFISVIIAIFFTFHLNKISYGLPFFVNLDEIEFQGSVLSSISFLTGYFELNYNPYYAPLINLILIIKIILVNEFLINFLSFDQIKSKIYFNPEIFIYYGRLASLLITSFSIFFLYLIFKKLRINLIIYSTLLITFCSSLVIFNVATIMSKNSCNLLVYTVQLYFLIKYLLKIEKFNFKSYVIFSLLASFAWGVNYWPALVSIYSVFLLHFKKFQFTKIFYLFVFLLIFVSFGPLLNSLFINMGPLDHIFFLDEQENIKKIEIGLLINNFVNNFIDSLKIIFSTDKNIILLIISAPFFLFNKNMRFKKEFFIIFFLFVGPLLIFGISGNFVPQLRYFAGIVGVILVLTGIIFNELMKKNFKYFLILLLLSNAFFIFHNFKQSNKIYNALSMKHSFFNLNKKIEDEGIDRSKILYLVDLNFQESLDQNLYYINLYKNNLIKKDKDTKQILYKIEKKISKINNSKDLSIQNKEFKKNIVYFNYTYFPIENLKLFFDFLKNDFEYVVIENSIPFYLSDKAIHKEIKLFVKQNLSLIFNQFEKDKIFLRSQQSLIHYYANALSQYDFAENIENENLDVIYGSNFSLYKLSLD